MESQCGSRKCEGAFLGRLSQNTILLPKETKVKTPQLSVHLSQLVTYEAKSIERNTGAPGRPGGRFLQISDSQTLEPGY